MLTLSKSLLNVCFFFRFFTIYIYTGQTRYVECKGTEKTSMHREIRYTEVHFIEVLPVLLRYVEIHNNVYDYLFNKSHGKS